MVMIGAVKEVTAHELEATFEGGDEGESMHKKYQDCICCPCDFIIGIGLLIALVTQIAVIVAQFVGKVPNSGTILFVLLYCTLVRLMWTVVACCFCAMPKCAGLCRCPLRTIFGLLTFIIVVLGFDANNQAEIAKAVEKSFGAQAAAAFNKTTDFGASLTNAVGKTAAKKAANATAKAQAASTASVADAVKAAKSANASNTASVIAKSSQAATQAIADGLKQANSLI